MGQVVAEQERFDEFEDLAPADGIKGMEADHPPRGPGNERRKKQLAIKVFEAALTKGDHLDFLMKKYEQLKQDKWNPDPRK